MVASFVVGLVLLTQLLQLPTESRAVDVTFWDWIVAGPLTVPFGLLLDPLSMVMVLLVTGVGSLIHIYSIGYMAHDARPVRYFVYLNLFVVAMLLLVLANNYLVLFLGWEGVGLCSFLLIGAAFERKVAQDAAIKAFVMNRIGDFGLMLAMLAIYKHFGTLNFGAVLPRAAQVLAGQSVMIFGGPFGLATLICVLMFIGVAGKSAQIPLFVWLPDAMAGPTPASALIHAATMVTSGIYLIARSHAIFALSPAAGHFVAFLGALTAFVAASIAIGQYDIKRVLAYSTVSQLGFMVAAAGLGAYTAAIFHLLTHGIFKALLFLAAGSVIHGAHEVQDMRLMGGLRKAMPRTFWTYMFGTLALAGIFPWAGFWSKDDIIAAAFHSAPQGNSLVLTAVLLVISALLTAFYMGRQIGLVFFGQQRDTSYHAHESEGIMTIPLVILAIGALVGGMLINLPFKVPVIGELLTRFLEPVFTGEQQLPINYLSAGVTLLLSLLFGYLGFRVYAYRSFKTKFRDPLSRYVPVWEAFETGFGSDDYVHFFMRPFVATARFLSRIVDPLGIDGLVNGAGRLVGLTGTGLRRGQSGYLRNYTLVFLAGAVAVIGYFGYAATR
ncbi:MAG: NADH-quinone oxidoreductase subunit L [Herpetosiphon sp.]